MDEWRLAAKASWRIVRIVYLKTAETPNIVERVVADIDEIVRLVRFPGWQGTLASEREIKKALRKALFKYKLHADEELFEKAYSYIRQYY